MSCDLLLTLHRRVLVFSDQSLVESKREREKNVTHQLIFCAIRSIIIFSSISDHWIWNFLTSRAQHKKKATVGGPINAFLTRKQSQCSRCGFVVKVPEKTLLRSIAKRFKIETYRALQITFFRFYGIINFYCNPFSKQTKKYVFKAPEKRSSRNNSIVEFSFIVMHFLL